MSDPRFWGTGLFVASKELLGGRYRLMERLGGGATSVVWRAHDQVLGRYVAIKVLAAAYAADAHFRARIRSEAQAAAKLNHPNVTNVFDYGESTVGGERVPYVVMELLAGPTLAERMQVGKLPVDAALRIATQVAQALAAAHARGLVHCDIKPANIMLTRRGAKVVDFGISGVAGQRDPHAQEGQIWGTPAYIAPERLAGEDAVAAADVYALGIMLYQTLSGTSPWQVANTEQMLLAHAEAEPAPLPPIDGLPPTIASLCSRCLAKDPVERPSAAWVARELRTARGELAADTPAPAAKPSAPRRRRPVRLAAQALVVLAAALLAGYCGLAGKEPGQSDAQPPLPELTVTPDTSDGRDSGASPTDPSAPPKTGPTGPAIPGDRPGAASGRGVGSGSGAGAGSGSGSGSGSGTGSGSGSGSGSTTRPGGGGSGPGGGSGSTPDPVDKTITTVGGTVVARCVGSTASILSTSPLAGFAVGNLNRGPASEVGVSFNALLTTVTVAIHCSNGVPTPSIKTS